MRGIWTTIDGFALLCHLTCAYADIGYAARQESEIKDVMASTNRSRRSFESGGKSVVWYQPLPFDSISISYLVEEHNKYRRMMRASNMKMIRWSSALALKAQIHANRCLFQHSVDRVSTGENIWAAPYANIKGAVKFWFTEVLNRQCGCTNQFKPCCGHYTQVVWAETELMGCGMSRCNNIKNAFGQRFILVCHYWPSGNWVQIRGNTLVGLPAFKRSQSGPCSECEEGAQCENYLCVRKSEKKELT